MNPIKSAAHKDIGSPSGTDPGGKKNHAVDRGRRLRAVRQRWMVKEQKWTGKSDRSRGQGGSTQHPAEEKGLVNSGNLEAAIAKAATLAGISGKPRRSLYRRSRGKEFTSSHKSSRKTQQYVFFLSFFLSFMSLAWLD